MINIFLFLSLLFLATFLIGQLIEKIRVPWIFAALLLGAFLSLFNPFSSITSSPIILFLAKLGMYFLLFIIGFEINIQGILSQKRYIFKTAFLVILLEALAGGVIIHFLFQYNWFISFLVALSFATVGEAILVPILDEFKIINTRLGQMLIGIGTLDDVAEIIALLIVTTVIGIKADSSLSTGAILISLVILFIATVALINLKKRRNEFIFLKIETLFLLTVFIFFLFLGIGQYGDLAPLAALLAGINLKSFVPEERIKFIESEIKSLAYGFFGPIFFLWVGLSLNIKSIIYAPLLLLVIVLVSTGAKFLGSYFSLKEILNFKKIILLGLGLSIRFSTSIIIIKILFEHNIIDHQLFSILIASSIIFTFAIPVIFSNLLVRWQLIPK